LVEESNESSEMKKTGNIIAQDDIEKDTQYYRNINKN